MLSCCRLMCAFSVHFVFFFFNDTATTEIYTLSLHDALPILAAARLGRDRRVVPALAGVLLVDLLFSAGKLTVYDERSEEHTSELQSRQYLVCRLLLLKKKKTTLNVHKYIINYPQYQKLYSRL